MKLLEGCSPMSQVRTNDGNDEEKQMLKLLWLIRSWKD